MRLFAVAAALWFVAPAVSSYAQAPAAPAPAAADAARPVVTREGGQERVAMLRVRAEVVDNLVNQAGEVSIARSRLEGELRSLTGALSELTGNIARLRAHLTQRGAWDETHEVALLKQCNDTVQAAVQKFLDTPPPAPARDRPVPPAPGLRPDQAHAQSRG